MPRRAISACRYRTSEPVGRLILERLPATLELSFCAAVFVLFVGVPMGVYTGLYPQALVEPPAAGGVADRRLAAAPS